MINDIPKDGDLDTSKATEAAKAAKATGDSATVAPNDRKSTAGMHGKAPSIETIADKLAPPRDKKSTAGMQAPSPDRIKLGSFGNAGEAAGQVTVRESLKPAQLRVPEEFRGSTNAELISYLERRIAEGEPMTKAQLDKLRKRQAAQRMMAGIGDMGRAIANLWATSQYAPNAYQHERDNTTERMQQQFDKAEADRKGREAEWLNYVLMRGRLRDQERQQGLQIWQTEQNLVRQHQRDAAEDLYRQQQLEAKEAAQAAAQERWQQEHDEGKRRFDVNSKQQEKQLGLQWARFAKEKEEDRKTFQLGRGYGNVTLTKEQYSNPANVAHVFATLPAGERAKVVGDPIYGYETDENGKTKLDPDQKPIKTVIGYNPPSTEAMLKSIGSYLESNNTSPEETRETREALQRVAGVIKGEAPKTEKPKPY